MVLLQKYIYIYLALWVLTSTGIEAEHIDFTFLIDLANFLIQSICYINSGNMPGQK